MKKIVLIIFTIVFFSSLANAQNVGISNAGGLTPQSLLHIHSTAAGQIFQLSNVNTLGGNSPTAASGFNISIDATKNIVFNQYENAKMSFYTSNTERLTILSGGNVGIGTASPGAANKLDVSYSTISTGGKGINVNVTGNATWSSIDYGVFGSVANSNASIAYGTYGQATSAAASSGRNWGVVGYAGNGGTNVGVQGSTASLTGQTAGILGIRTGFETFDPSATMSGDWAGFFSGEVKMTGQLTLSLATGTSPLAVTSTTLVSNLNSDMLDGYHASAFAQASNAFVQSGNSFGSIGTLGTNDPYDLAFETNGTEKMRILSGGNIGIGTASPAAGLHLYQDKYTLYGPNSTWGAYLQVGGNGRVTTYASVAATNGNLHIDAADGGFATYINYYSQNNTFINAQAGNVGIGTTSPSQKLEVSGNIQLSNNGNGIYMRDETTGTNWHVHDHGDRIRTYNGSTELTYVTTADLGGNCILNQYDSAQSANMWITGETRTGSWFRNSTAGCGLYNESTGSGIYSPSANLMALYNASSLQITSASTGSGNLRFDAANPYIVASSYYMCPGGAYFNGGTVYTEAQYQCRGSIHNDAGGDLTIAGGTNGTTYFSGPISGMSGNFPSNNMVRLTPNLHLNSNAGSAVILNWDNGTTGNTQTLRVGNGSGSDVFNVWASGNTSIGTTPINTRMLYSYHNQTTANGDGQASIYGWRTRDSQNDGSGYYAGSSNNAITGYNYWGDLYTFGVFGHSDGDYTRTGGTIGETGGTWGSLGYKGSNSVSYGVYGSTAYSAGGGYMPESNTILGIGGGFYGGIMGGWSRGEVLGFTSSGELYASYNLGNEYTSGVSADIVTNNEERIPAYSVTSNEVKVYSDGKAKLVNGYCRVTFEKSFMGLLSMEKTPTVTVSALGESEGIFISSIDKDGFVVKESHSGQSNIEFTWIAIGTRFDANNVSNLPEALKDKDFDNNMKGVMFNENNKEQNATPIWWDGTKLRFDTPPPDKTIKKDEFQNSKYFQNSGDDVNKLIQNSKTSEKQNNDWKPTPNHPIQDQGNKFEKSSYPTILKENK